MDTPTLLTLNAGLAKRKRINKHITAQKVAGQYSLSSCWSLVTTQGSRDCHSHSLNVGHVTNMLYLLWVIKLRHIEVYSFLHDPKARHYDWQNVLHVPDARETAFNKPGFCVQGIIMVVGSWIVKEGSGCFTERTQMSLWIR